MRMNIELTDVEIEILTELITEECRVLNIAMEDGFKIDNGNERLKDLRELEKKLTGENPHD